MSRINGFTLTELLVAVAVIAILAGIVLSMIPRMREAARTAACASNERQWGRALIGYAGEHDGQMMTTVDYSLGPNRPVPQHVWAVGAPTIRPTELNLAALDTYMGPTRDDDFGSFKGIMFCPSGPRKDLGKTFRSTVYNTSWSLRLCGPVADPAMPAIPGSPGGKTEWATFGYAYFVLDRANAATPGHDPQGQLIRDGRLTKAGSNTVLLSDVVRRPALAADEDWWISHRNNGAVTAINHDKFAYPTAPPPLRGGNILYGDGHVQFQGMSAEAAAIWQQSSCATAMPNLSSALSRWYFR